MRNLSKALASVKIAAVASFAMIATGIDAFDASAAEVRFLCADALESSMRELIPAFEKATGHSVKMMLANAGTNTERIRKGDEADLAIVLPQQWEALRQEGKIDPAVRVAIGKVGLGAFCEEGRPSTGYWLGRSIQACTLEYPRGRSAGPEPTVSGGCLRYRAF